MAELAEEAGVGNSFFSRIFRLAVLSPTVVRAILRGEQPIELTAKALAADTHLPLGWGKQSAKLYIS